MIVKRIIAFDVGKQRIGYALSDEEGQVVARSGWYEATSFDDAIIHAVDIVHRSGSRSVVVGLPITLSGRDSPSTDYARRFADALKEGLDMTIELVDERFTTVIAAQARRNTKTKGPKGKLDATAATVLLQHYLEARR